MQALIVSEGPHESGGALEALVTRLATSGLRCEHDRVACRDIHAHHGRGQGYYKRAVRWLREAEKRGFDALVLVIDEDGRSERVKQFTEAQGYEHVSLPRALGVAIRTFDAWMLGDERALTAVLGCQVPRQPTPETIVHPKRTCSELLRQADCAMTQREMYSAVATAADIETLEERCPRGFAPFARRVRAL